MKKICLHLNIMEQLFKYVSYINIIMYKAPLPSGLHYIATRYTSHTFLLENKKHLE